MVLIYYLVILRKKLGNSYSIDRFSFNISDIVIKWVRDNR